ncbi:MAG: hypothetical protein HDR28_12275 [Lachnospiraceae bacterium]|nr:hypothetical protein [Lachnospiraceae bacterium]
MNKKDMGISFIISLAAAGGYEALKSTIGSIQGWRINGFCIFIIVMLLGICLSLWFNLRRYKAIMNKINIRGKEYYDIFEDIVYYQIRKPRNIMQIDKLRWVFNFTPSTKSNVFLDLHAEWEMFFTASKERIQKIKIGIHGGDFVSEQSMNIEACQGNGKAGWEFQREQDDCTFLNVILNTNVVKKGRDKITLKYNWEQFMITDRKDDYIYLFPYAIAPSMRQFELATTHPYECKATVVVLKHKWTGEYDKIEIDSTNSIRMNIEIQSEHEYDKKHRIVINEIEVKDVYLVVFEKR